MPYHAGHPPVKEERIVASWTAPNGARSYEGARTKLTETMNGEQSVLVLTLSGELATKIQKALSMGRQHRLSAQYTKAKIKELETERLDNAGLVEALEFELQHKKKEIDQSLVMSEKQRKELNTLAQDLHRMRANHGVIERNLVYLGEGDVEEVGRWRDAWFEVDRLLDVVWMEAGILKQYESTGEGRNERPAATPGNRSGRERGLAGGQESARDDGTNGRGRGGRRDRSQSRRRRRTENEPRGRCRRQDGTRVVDDSDELDQRNGSSDQEDRNRHRRSPSADSKTREERTLRIERLVRQEREDFERGRRSSSRLRSRQASARRGETRQRRRDSPRQRSPSRSRSRSPSLDVNRERRDVRRGGEYRDREDMNQDNRDRVGGERRRSSREHRR